MAASPLVTEAMGHAGFQWGVIDMEHTPLDMMEVIHLLQAAGNTKMVPIVRVPWNDAVSIKRVLDAGAQTLLIPVRAERRRGQARGRRHALPARRHPRPGRHEPRLEVRHHPRLREDRQQDGRRGAATRNAGRGGAARSDRRGAGRRFAVHGPGRPVGCDGPCRQHHAPRRDGRDGRRRAALQRRRHAGRHGRRHAGAGRAVPRDGLRLRGHRAATSAC